MKRVGNLFEQIIDFGNLELAFCKAVRGKRDRADAREFAANLDSRRAEMVDGLWRGRFPLGRCTQFVIHDPKQRIITAPCFAERVLHHAIMNVCEPVFENWLIDDTYACRTGRGRDAAIRRALYFAGQHPFFLKMDVRKYFESISHDILISRLERVFKDIRLVDLLERIIFSFQGEAGRGLPIGSLTSQHFANFYLGWFDRFVKETLRVKGYVRYMDDMLLWSHSAAELQTALDACREFLAVELDLEIKPHPYINRSAHGVDFLGCRVLPDHVILNRRSRERFRRKMGCLEEDYLQGRIDELELQERGTSLVAFARAAGVKSWHFRRSVLQRLPVSGRRPRTG
jgi:hypothetical protein